MKNFSDIHAGDKIYTISIKDSKFKSNLDNSFISIEKVRERTNSSGDYGNSMCVTLENNGGVFYPNSSLQSHVTIESYDSTGQGRINSKIYATTKRACLERAKSIIDSSSVIQRRIIDRMQEQIISNNNMVSKINESLKDADMPDTMEEFAEMPL